MNKPKERIIVVAFSGGLTSATMAALMQRNQQPNVRLLFVFYNTGLEREETLTFVNECDKYLKLNLVWLESHISPQPGIGIIPRVTSYQFASRHGEPFESGIVKYGLPSTNSSWCSSKLKSELIRRYMNKQRIRGYFTAIGIRIDEIDRIHPQAREKRLIYPLVSQFRYTKEMVWKFWQTMPFTLNLKSYEGNCTLCWKKSERKIMTIIRERPDLANWWLRMEVTHGGRMGVHSMYRNGLTIRELIAKAEQPFKKAICDIQYHNANPLIFENELDTPNGCEESCNGF